MSTTNHRTVLLGLSVCLASCDAERVISHPPAGAEAPLCATFHRRIEGIDGERRCLSEAELKRELNDPALEVLRTKRPRNLDELVKALTESGLRRIRADRVAEGGQIPTTVHGAGRDADRSLRYVVSFGKDKPTVYISARPPGGFMPPSAVLEVIAFDEKKRANNYYLLTGEPKAWTWAGDATHAFQEASRGKGCFQCHTNGRLIMKELAIPWSNWHSPRAVISPERVPEKVAGEDLFKDGSPSAELLERDVESSVRGDVERWVAARVTNGRASKVGELLRPLFEATTVNLESSHQASAGPGPVGVPPMLLLNHALLSSSQINLGYGSVDVKLPREEYGRALEKLDFRLSKWRDDKLEYCQRGSTFQALLVPVASFEDNEAVEELIATNVISDRFAASVLMVDFPNPVYSAARAKLATYAQKIPGGKADGRDIPDQFARLVEGCNGGSCAAEQQFLRTWKDDNWKQNSKKAIDDYVKAVKERLNRDPAGATEDVVKLSISRRTQLDTDEATCHLAEFDLLLPCTSFGDVVSMLPDGTLSEARRAPTGCTREPKRCDASCRTAP